VEKIRALNLKIFVKPKNIGLIIGVEMMPKSISYQEELIESLQDPLEAAPYIEACLEECDSGVLRLAIRDIIESHKRLNKLSDKAKVLSEKLDLILSETKSDDFFCLQNLLEELGFHLAVTVKPEQNGKIGDIT
jgi:DNA-binding phage protein